MEINEYLKILRKRGWIVILVALISAGSAFGVSKMQTPIYTASVKLSVVPARATDWGSSNSLKDLLRNYAENIRTHTISNFSGFGPAITVCYGNGAFGLSRLNVSHKFKSLGEF